MGLWPNRGRIRTESGRQPLALVPERPEQIALYCGSSDLGKRIRRLLTNAEFETAECRDTFSGLLKAGHSLGIVGLEECSVADAEWLEHSVARSPGNQSCVVVAPLSLSNLQCLRGLARDVFRVVWDEEADERLAAVLDEVSGQHEWRTDPLESLGRRLLATGKLRPSVRTVIVNICHLPHDASPRPPPKRSVVELARLVHIEPATLCRYWKADVPLRCGPKQLLSWAVLLWAVRRRSEAKWDTVAKMMRVRRRTLERLCSKLAAYTLAEAAREPEMVRDRFAAWVAAVWETE